MAKETSLSTEDFEPDESQMKGENTKRLFYKVDGITVANPRQIWNREELKELQMFILHKCMTLKNM